MSGFETHRTRPTRPEVSTNPMTHESHDPNPATHAPRPALTPEEGGFESEIPAERLQKPAHAHRNADGRSGPAAGPSEPRKPLVLRDNTVFIGRKNAMSYVLAVVSQFTQGSNEVKVKARGNAISRAVDVSQIVKNKFVPELKIGLSDVSTEDIKSEDGRQSRVSSLTLLLSK